MVISVHLVCKLSHLIDFKGSVHAEGENQKVITSWNTVMLAYAPLENHFFSHPWLSAFYYGNNKNVVSYSERNFSSKEPKFLT